MLIRFLHIEKTGGSSVRAALERALPEQYVLDYNPGDCRPPWLLEFMGPLRHPGSPHVLDQAGAIAEAERRGVRVLLGHGNFDRWDLIPPARTFTLLRDPVQRVVSGWLFSRRHFDRTWELLQYARRESRRNLQARRLEGLELEHACIGVTDRMEAFLNRLRQRFGLELPELYINANPRKAHKAQYELAPRERSEIEQLNALDMELYERAQRWRA